jgi:hypothetical protein
LATTPSGTAIVFDSEPSWLRNSALYRHCLPGMPQYPLVSPNAMSTWWLAGSPLSHMIPRSVPVIAKRWMVWFGLSGPVTQPTIDVPGGDDGTGAAAGAGAGWAAGGWWVVPLGCGDGTTAACCWTWAERCGGGVSALSRAGKSPNLGSAASSFAPAGMCPIGRLNGASRDGLGISKACVGSGCAWAAAPSHGSAFACGATPSTAINPRAAIPAIDTEATRRRGDISHLSVRDVGLTSAMGSCDDSDRWGGCGH